VGRNDDDLALVQRCLAGEPGAWRDFVDRFAGVVRAVARRYFRLHGRSADGPDVDDMVQEVFYALTRRNYRLLRNYDPTYAFTTYIGVITRTEVHRDLRKKRPLVGGPDDLETAAPVQDDAADEVEQLERSELLKRALDDLPPRDAEILRLRFIRGLDYRAIATALGIPEASVGQTLFRAKKRLKERLVELLGGEAPPPGGGN